jgi:hypothetical protein
MTEIIFKPELRTNGGEATSIYTGGRWVGDMYLIYREKDILTGTVNLDANVISAKKASRISNQIQLYIEHLGDSLNIARQDVNVVFGDYVPKALVDNRKTNWNVSVVNEDDNGIHYDLYDRNGELAARAMVSLVGTDLKGSLIFRNDPDTERVDEAVEAIVSRFDEELLDSVQFNVETQASMSDHDLVNRKYIQNNHERDTTEIITDEGLGDWVSPEHANDTYMGKSSLDTGLHLAMVGEDRKSQYYDVTDGNEDTVAEVIFDQDDGGVEVFVHFLQSPSKSTKRSVVKELTRRAMSQDYEWMNLRMQFQGKAIGGFMIEKGS